MNIAQEKQLNQAIGNALIDLAIKSESFDIEKILIDSVPKIEKILLSFFKKHKISSREITGRKVIFSLKLA